MTESSRFSSHKNLKSSYQNPSFIPFWSSKKYGSLYVFDMLRIPMVDLHLLRDHYGFSLNIFPNYYSVSEFKSHRCLCSIHYIDKEACNYFLNEKKNWDTVSVASF